jgi:glutathione S-transferase
MKLIASLTSPFARKARIVIAEKHIECELVLDIPWNPDTRVADFNPLGKIPVLILDDGTSLFDSRVIVEYLDHVSPVGSMLPKDSHDRIMTKRWEALADGISDAAAAIFLERKRPETPAGNEWIARQQAKLTRGLAAMSDTLGEQTWCVGERFSLGDIAVGCSLGYVALRFPEIDWRNTHPNLARLNDKLRERASFKSTEPPV